MSGGPIPADRADTANVCPYPSPVPARRRHRMACEAADEDRLTRIQKLIAGRLEKFGRREHLIVTWRPAQDSHGVPEGTASPGGSRRMEHPGAIAATVTPVTATPAGHLVKARRLCAPAPRRPYTVGGYSTSVIERGHTDGARIWRGSGRARPGHRSALRGGRRYRAVAGFMSRGQDTPGAALCGHRGRGTWLRHRTGRPDRVRRP
ncbi:MAG TPA: hypothetical protein VE733_00375 [Streptosporangiaceae bacterium]|nr:hypothetical protein [Streptosporangiaceae bacterium]